MRLQSDVKFCRTLVLFFLFFSVVISTYGQQTIKVSGRLIDESTRNPVAGATIAVKGNDKIGAITADDGTFSIDVDPTATLVISSLGYVEIEEAVKGRQLINLSLTMRSSELSDVVVIGYGSRRKKDLTGAYGVVNERDLAKSTASSPEMALQGRLAGVQVSTPSGNPNSRTNIRIRGVTTITNSGDYTNEPLYVIDGMPLTEGGNGNPDPVVRDVRTPNNPLSLLNPNDIESITVLKDASAAAIYGVRAANGVVLITTKRGKGKPRIEVNAFYGVQNATKKGIDVLNTAQFVALYNEAYANQPERNSGGALRPIAEVFGQEWNPASPRYLGNSGTYDWQKEFYNTNAPVKNFNIKLLGATDALSYYVSGDVNTLEGTLKGSMQDRYTITANIVSKVSKVVQMGVNVRGVYSKSQNGLGGTNEAVNASPWQPVYGDGPGGFAPNQFVDSFVFNTDVLSNGDPAWNPQLETTPPPFYSYVNGARAAPGRLYGLQTRGNILSSLDRSLGYNDYDNYRAIGNAYLQITPLNGLSIKGTLYGDFYNDLNTSVSRFDTWVYGATPSNPYEGVIKKYDTTMLANISIRNRKNISYTTEVSATYSTEIASRHAIELTAVANKQSWDWGLSNSNGLLSTLNKKRYNISNASNLHNGGGYRPSWEGERVLIGYVGRVNYKFDDKYILDATVRRDGSSRFAPGNRWGTFFAVAGAWRLTGEKFMQNANFRWISDLKLRANWGELGKETTFGWKYLSIVNPGISMPNYSLGSGNGDPLGSQQTGAYLPDFANTDLTWEKVTTSGVGIDAGLFRNKLNITVEYYNRLTTGMIQQVPAPYSSGIQNAIDLNIGEMKNSGVEFSAGYNTNIGPVNVGFSGNITTVRNRVTKLYNDINLGDTYVGMPFGFIYGYKVGGIFQTQAEIDAWRTQYFDVNAGQSATDPGAGAYVPGDMWFQDIGTESAVPGKFDRSPDGVINANDRTILGKTVAGLLYGFGANASFANIELSFFFRGEADVQRVNYLRMAGESMSSNGINQLSTVLNRWTPGNPSTTMPRASYGDPRGNARMSDRWVEDAGFLRLQNIQLGYRLPLQLLSKTNFVQGIRLYVMGTNLLTITNYTGIDPENDFNPPAKQIVFGINATF